MRTLTTLILLGALVGAAGCKKHEEDVKKRDAVNRKITEEDQRMSGATDQATEDRRMAERAIEDHEEAEIKAGEAQRKATAERDAEQRKRADAEVQENLAQERAAGQDMLKKNLDAIDRKAEDLTGRIDATKGKTRKNAEAAAAEVQSRKATVEADLNSLQSLSGDEWMQKKTEVEQDLAGLSAAVDNLERTLGKK
jgi:colicin import membrane protein